MPFDVQQIASDILSAAHQSSGTPTVRFDIARWPAGPLGWSPRQSIQFLPRLKSTDCGSRASGPMRGGFAQFGIEFDNPNSGRYQGVPVVLSATIPFDAMELVIEPRG